MTTWQFVPLVSALLVATAALYLVGVVAVARRHPARPWPWPRTLAFGSALVTVAIALQSSIGGYDDTLFWVHMVQHLLLIMVAPPLFVAGRPITLLMHATRNPWHTWTKRAVRSHLAATLTWPPLAFAIYTVTIVGTHLTSFTNVTLTHPLVHDLEHVLYLLAGYLFYLPLLGSEPIRWRLSFPARLLVLVASMPVDTFVGVVLTQTNRELFPAYTAAHRAWGPSLIDDLHAGGGVMWVGGDGLMLLFIVLASVVFARDARGTAGRWLETARRNTLAEHGAAPPSARPRPVDDDEQQLAAYNAYLADLARGRRRGPV